MRKICVFGDLMLDSWVQCDPLKLSQEAPVIVAAYQGTTYSPGGAGNVAVNCKHLGAETVHAVGLVGKGLGNEYGTSELIQCLDEQQIETGNIVPCCEWMTIEKRRFVDKDGRHLLRVDREDLGAARSGLDLRDHISLGNCLDFLLPACDTLVVSDYGKGTCDPKLTQNQIRAWRKAGKFVVVNGKPGRHGNYEGAKVFIVNRSEAEAIAAMESNRRQGRNEDLCREVFRATGITHVIVTVGSEGLYWHNSKIGHVAHVPAPVVQIADVAGAGDTITATIACEGEVTYEVLELAVRNAADVVSQRGTSFPV